MTTTGWPLSVMGRLNTSRGARGEPSSPSGLCAAALCSPSSRDLRDHVPAFDGVVARMSSGVRPDGYQLKRPDELESNQINWKSSRSAEPSKMLCR